MDRQNNLNDLSLELRSRIKKEILEPLNIVEQLPKDNPNSVDLIDKVFRDFKKASDKIWEDVLRRINTQQKV